MWYDKLPIDNKERFIEPMHAMYGFLEYTIRGNKSFA